MESPPNSASLSLTTMTKPTMENLTDSEKLHLWEVMQCHSFVLLTNNSTEASIKFHTDLRHKLNLILFPQLNEHES
jgi:hypothetical protein